MKHIFTLSLCFLALSLSAQETITYPYNPDGDADGLVAVPDIQDLLAVYGSPFSPAEIMVGDTALSEWIQILYQALQDQQAFIESLTSGAGAGECSLSWPEGVYGEPVTSEVTANDVYTVPMDKHLYIIGWRGYNPTIQGYHTQTPQGIPQILNSGEVLGSTNDSPSYFNGLLIDASQEVSAITLGINAINPYQVPIGKRLYITHWLSNGGEPRVQGKELPIPYISPIIVNSGEILETSSDLYESTFNGYLVDEDYFADCGGGGSSDGVFLNMALGETEHYNFSELEWLPQMNQSGYFIPLQFENDGIFRVTGGNSQLRLIVVPDSITEDQFSNDNLAEANFESYWEGESPAITIPLNSNEQIVLYGGTGVVEEETTAGRMNLFWTPLQNQMSLSEEDNDDEYGVSQYGDTLFLPNGNYLIIPNLSQSNLNYIFNDYGEVTDADGNVYTTLVYGENEWMVQNLKTQIGNFTTVADHQGGFQSYADSVGYYYSASDVISNVCPSGWHVATILDWQDLHYEIYGTPMNATGYTNSGNGFDDNNYKLLWSNHQGGTNQSAFNLFRTGWWENEGTFISGEPDNTKFWTTNVCSGSGMSMIQIYSEGTGNNYWSLDVGCTSTSNIKAQVRCVKD